jgi:hypothetical protein
MRAAKLAALMLLSELLEQADIKQAGIVIIGSWKTDTNEYLVLGQGQAPFPRNGITHEILVRPGHPDPELEPGEAETIRRRFKLDKSEFRLGSSDDL